MTTWAILVAGGEGKRFGTGQSKLMASLDGQPVIRRSFETLSQIPGLDGIVVVAAAPWLKQYQACLGNCRWTEGGPSRRDSVWQGLLQLPSEANIVVVHDAARPLVRVDRILAAFAPVQQGMAMATSLGLPVCNTIKQVKTGQPWVEATLERSCLWQTHTPQVFDKKTLIDAHQSAPTDRVFPDDASLVEYGGYPVLMVTDSPDNLKITVPVDLVMAEAILAHCEVTL